MLWEMEWGKLSARLHVQAVPFILRELAPLYERKLCLDGMFRHDIDQAGWMGFA